MIVADVGGTNGRFAIANLKTFEISDISVFPCANFTTFDDMFAAFIETLKGKIPCKAQLAIAGEMTPRQGNLWHFNWNISASRLEEKFNLDQVLLMNDYEAMVRSVPYLKSDDLFTVTDFDTGLKDGPFTVFGVGSGLGGSIAKPSEGKLEVISSEIGHVSFAPTSEIQSELLAFVKKSLSHVSNESFLSGPGLSRIYEFVVSNGSKPYSSRSPAQISTAALCKADDDCIETVDIFLEILASVAGDIALSQGARGGMYISGGIVPRMVNLIDRKAFISRFNNKGPMREYVSKIPVKIIMSDMPALLGAASEIE